MSALVVSPAEIAIAATTLVVGSALSLSLALQIHRTLWIAAVRMLVQLVAVGYALRFVFRARWWWLTTLVIVVMLAATTFEAASRPKRTLHGWWRYGVGGIAMTVATFAMISFAVLSTPHEVTAWSDPRRLVPMVGIVLGAALNATSIGLNTLLATVARDRASIEARLALGDAARDAFAPLVRETVRAGIIPVMNQMAGAGLVTMPGIMTGQILGGMDPLHAAESQILIMLLLAGSALSGVILAVRLAVWRLTDERDRLRLDRLR